MVRFSSKKIHFNIKTYYQTNKIKIINQKLFFRSSYKRTLEAPFWPWLWDCIDSKFRLGNDHIFGIGWRREQPHYHDHWTTHKHQQCCGPSDFRLLLFLNTKKSNVKVVNVNEWFCNVGLFLFADRRRPQRRRRHRLPPMSRTSSYSSITDSTMSLNIITVSLNMDTVNFLGISIVGQSNKGGDGGIYVGSIMKGYLNLNNF